MKSVLRFLKRHFWCDHHWHEYGDRWQRVIPRKCGEDEPWGIRGREQCCECRRVREFIALTLKPPSDPYV